MQAIGAGYPETNLTKALDYSGANLVYLGSAVPGTLKSAAGWRITRYTYSGTNLTDIQYAGGSTDFTYVWNDRASYSYS